MRLLALITIAAAILVSCESLDATLAESPIVRVQDIAGSSGEIRILLLGDWGTGGAQQLEVAAGAAARQANSGYDFALLLGDNFYETGVTSSNDPQFQDKFTDIYTKERFPIPFYVVLGNHDWLGSPAAQYEHQEADGRWRAPGPAWYCFVTPLGKARCMLVGLDSMLLMSSPDFAQRVLAFLVAAARERPDEVMIIAMHHPLLSSGFHGNTAQLLSLFAPLLAMGKPDVAIAGHDHDLELLATDQDADGGDELFIVSGAAAKTKPITAGPNSLWAREGAGFAELVISSQVGVGFRAENNSELYHH